MKYTQGPWTQDKYGTILSPNGETVRVEGVALSMRSDEETRANARLIAAAPDLLGALKLAKIGIEAHIEYARGKEDYTLFTASVLSLQTIDEAIKKASGE